MSPQSANPLLQEYGIVKDLKISPDLFEDQCIEIPSRWDCLRWLLFGKPLKIVWRKGLDGKKGEVFLTILGEERYEQTEEVEKMKRDMQNRGGV